MARYWQNVSGALVELSPRNGLRSPVDGMTYPASYFEDATWRATHGVLIETVSGTRPDERFYTVTESLSLDAVRTYQGAPKALDVIKAAKRAEARKLYWDTCAENDGILVDLGGTMVRIKVSHESQQELERMKNVLTASGGTQNAVTRSGAVVTWTAALAATALAAVEVKVATAQAAEAVHVAAINAYTPGQEQALIDYAVV